MAKPRRELPWTETRNGIFYASWYEPDTRTKRSISLRTANRAEAEARFAAFLTSGQDIRAPRVGRLTVARALQDYISEYAEGETAAPRRQKEAARHLTEFFGDRPIEDIDIEASEAYATARYAGMVGGGSRRKSKVGSPGTVRRELNVLVAASNHALKRKRVERACIVKAPPERRRGEDDEAPYYTHEELETLFKVARQMCDERAERRRELAEAADPVDYEFEWYVKLLYQTGARRKSIEDLERRQVKLAQRRILLQKPEKKATKKRQPIVPILKAMEEPLNLLLEHGGETRLFRCADFYRWYVEMCERAGIDEERRNPHTMRHTRATHLLQDGKALYDVAKLLGDTTATIERVYGHHSHEHLARNLED